MNARPLPQPALLAVIFLLNLVEFLQSGMVAFAAAPTMGHIGASPEQYVLVSALYAAVAVVSISQMTVLVQRLGWRDYLIGSVVLFLVGAWVSAASASVPAFALGRALMAAGGGVFMTAARMLINLFPPSPQRMLGIAAFGVSLASGLSLAPWVAGVFVGAEKWSAMFLLAAVPAALAGALAWRYLPDSASTLDTSASRFHLADGLALGIAAFLVLYAVQRLGFDWYGERGRFGLGLLAGGAAALWFLFAHFHRQQPFLRLGMLRNRRYLTGLSIFSLCYALLGAFNTVVPQLLQRVLGVAFEQAGALQAAGLTGALPGFACLLLVVRKRPHATKFYVSAFLLLTAFGWHFAHLDPAAPPWLSVAPWLGLFGAFVTIGMATTALHAFKDFQGDNVLFSHAQQLKNMLGQFGLALGVGVTTVVLQQRAALHGARLAESASAPPMVQSQQAALLGSLDIFWLICGIGVVAAVGLAMQRRFD